MIRCWVWWWRINTFLISIPQDWIQYAWIPSISPQHTVATLRFQMITFLKLMRWRHWQGIGSTCDSFTYVSSWISILIDSSKIFMIKILYLSFSGRPQILEFVFPDDLLMLWKRPLQSLRICTWKKYNYTNYTVKILHWVFYELNVIFCACIGTNWNSTQTRTPWDFTELLSLMFKKENIFKKMIYLSSCWKSLLKLSLLWWTTHIG